MSQFAASANGPSTPSHTSIRSSLPTPSGIARRPSLAKATSPIDSPDTLYKKHSLAEAISRNDPAKYRTDSAAEEAERDGGSPLLTAGKLPRPSVVGRKSTSALRPRAGTPTGLATPPGSQLSPSGSTRLRLGSAASSHDGGSLLASPTSRRKPGSPGRAAELARSKSPLASTNHAGFGVSPSSAARGYATPKRISDAHGWASSAASSAPSPPSHAATTIASRAREQPSINARRGKDLEIGDLVAMDGTGLVGVLRYLGPVQGMNGSYAGLELFGEYAGKGKNNGSVKGVQYFACADGDGVFCNASKAVAISDSPPKDAVARPASAMSNRSNRHSDVHERPPSTTPGRRRASTISRPPSTTPSRTSSRASVRPPSATPGSRPASVMSASRPGSRLAARKSLGAVAAVQDDDEAVSRRRAKSSAESAAAAEKRITAGSRAHKLLGLTAKDLEQRQRDPVHTNSRIGARLGGSPSKAMPSSPLKDSLIGLRTLGDNARTPRSSLSSAASGGSNFLGLPKPRQSLGGLPTPRAAKGRVSMFGRAPGGGGGVATAMPPPRSPTKEGAERPASALSLRSSSRLSSVHGAEDAGADEAGLSGRKNSLDRTRNLLEEMDLTPRRPAASRTGRHQQSASFSAYGAVAAEEAFANESVAEAVVPLSLYEEQEAELEKLRAQLDVLEKQNAELTKQQGARKARMSEIRSNEAVLEEERAKMRAEAREKEKEMEEERQMEREDELRRRKQIEDREKELRDRLDETARSLSKLQDEHQKTNAEHVNRTRDLEAKVQESEKLVEEMKKSLKDQAQKADGEAKAALEVQLQVKDAEIDSLKSAVQRLEADLKRERKESSDQIDELKDAGREAISLFEQRIEEEQLKLQDYEQRAQDELLKLRAQYEAASARNGPGGISGATEIDNENLREQVAHLQDKVGNLEDQVAEAASLLEKEKEYFQKRKERSAEIEISLKNEIKRLKNEIERLVASEKQTMDRFDEVHAALEESKAALESERAELEVLRADVENIESLNGGSVRSTNSRDLADAKKKWEAEKAQFEAEIDKLTARLEGLAASREAAPGMLGVPASNSSSPSSKDGRCVSTSSSVTSGGTNRRSSPASINGGATGSEASHPSSTSTANQVSGLNYLVRQLTDENVEIKNKHKLLESETRDKLRAAEQKARTLELTVEVLEKELKAVSATASGRGKADGAGKASESERDLAVQLAESEQRLQANEAEIIKLQLRVKELQESKEQEVSALNKEVSELEALVEARIFREDELEGEIDRLSRRLEKEKNGDARTSAPARNLGGSSSGLSHAEILARGPQDDPDSTTANRTASGQVSDMATAAKEPQADRLDGGEEDDSEEFCGICSKRGHSLVDCSELKKPTQQLRALTRPTSSSTPADADAEPCDDCGEVGHRFEECPYANEIF
ncbi:hypothetical protein ACQY0O_002172 [Thecaphora frezii]